MIHRSDYESVVEIPDFPVSRTIRFYTQGFSPEWIMEHLLRREVMYLQMRKLPKDPRIPRSVKDLLIYTDE